MSASTQLPVLLALGGATREQALVAAIERSSSAVRIVRRCLDLADLLAAASSGTARVAVVSVALDRLDAAAVEHLVGAGLTVVGVVERTDPASAQRLRALGVSAVLMADETADGPRLLAELTALLQSVPDLGQASRPGPSVRVEPMPGRPRGRLVAVWGPAGAPGRTTVATTVADELARSKVETLLADADTYGPSIAQTLGVLDESSGLAAAVRDANSGILDVDALARSARSVRPHLRLLTGVTRADRWPELSGAALAVVWRTAGAMAAWTVVDCGFCLELDEELSFDTAAPRRNAATIVSLAAADVVLAVASADPIGLARLSRGMPALRERAPEAEVRVVVNQLRRGPVGRQPERRVAEVLERHAGVTDAIFVPFDRAGLDAALVAGRALGDVAPVSPARTALARLAANLGVD